MDAKVIGNIGRYLNHSCAPNVFVQNCFVDTHDLRFPWVAFFAQCHIPAGQELCWDYAYIVDQVQGKEIYCQCGSEMCRGRLLSSNVQFFWAKFYSPLVCRYVSDGSNYSQLNGKKDLIFNVKHILVFNCATFYRM